MKFKIGDKVKIATNNVYIVKQADTSGSRYGIHNSHDEWIGWYKEECLASVEQGYISECSCCKAEFSHEEAEKYEDNEEEEMKTSRENVFFLVWKAKPPTYRHNTKRDAVSEAMRLAKQNPSHKFYVLEAIGHTQIEPEFLEIDDLPF